MESLSEGAAPKGSQSAFRGTRMRVSVVIPALNEEEPIGDVVRAIPRGAVDEVLVVDNGSTDGTAERARTAGARVIAEPRRGYGRACKAGMAAVAADCDVIVFLDGDGSDCPEFIPDLVEPILAGKQDFVIGSRIRGRREPGSMNPPQLVAGWVAGRLLRLLYGVRFSDMCPFRAIRRDALMRLGMAETTYGWNLEMQMRAAKAGLRILELPVDHRTRRGGRSKVSGNLSGSLKAVVRITWTFLRLAKDLRKAAAMEAKRTVR
jgi:glycosyltransferase involved in cell wall biosynthesis